MEQEDFLSAYIYGLISFEEFVKAYMILESWDDEYISFNKWKKMTDHKPKLELGAKLIDKQLKESYTYLTKKFPQLESVIPYIDRGYNEAFVKQVLEERTGFAYTGYDPDNKRWIPVLREKFLKADQMRSAAGTLWYILTTEKGKMNIKNIDYGKYLREIGFF